MSDGGPGRDSLYEDYATTHEGNHSGAYGESILNRDLAPYMPRNKQAVCVDLGCGQGGVVAYQRALGYSNAVGVDLSPEQVSIAHGLGRDFVIRGDALDFLSEISDPPGCVTAFDFLEHLEGPAVLEVLHRVFEAIAPGGIFIARVPNSGSPFAGRIQYGDFTHLSHYTDRSIRQIARSVGFQNIRCRESRPAVSGWKSGVRRIVWTAAAGATKLAIAAESGQLRGNLVTSNMMIYISGGASDSHIQTRPSPHTEQR